MENEWVAVFVLHAKFTVVDTLFHYAVCIRHSNIITSSNFRLITNRCMQETAGTYLSKLHAKSTFTSATIIDCALFLHAFLKAHTLHCVGVMVTTTVKVDKFTRFCAMHHQRKHQHSYCQFVCKRKRLPLLSSVWVKSLHHLHMCLLLSNNMMNGNKDLFPICRCLIC